MGLALSGSSMIDELLLRTNLQFGAVNVSRTRCLFYVNRSVRYWDSQASYSFNCIGTVTIQLGFGQTKVLLNTLSPPIDLGKDLYLYTQNLVPQPPLTPKTIPYPVKRAALNEYGIRGLNSNTKVNNNIIDHYVVVGSTSSTTNPPALLIWPAIPGGFTGVGNPPSLGLIYHQVTPAMSDNSGSNTNYPDDFDDVILDFAEAELKRIYRVVGWEVLMQRVIEQGKMLVDQYRTNTDLPEGQAAALRSAQDRSIEGVGGPTTDGGA